MNLSSVPSKTNNIMNWWSESFHNISENVASHLPWQNKYLRKYFLNSVLKVSKSVLKHLNNEVFLNKDTNNLIYATEICYSHTWSGVLLKLLKLLETEQRRNPKWQTYLKIFFLMFSLSEFCSRCNVCLIDVVGFFPFNSGNSYY